MQTTSLELSKRLWEKGVRVESEFLINEENELIFRNIHVKHAIGSIFWYAYTLDELWGVLPDFIDVEERLKFCQNERYERTLLPKIIGYYAEDQGGGYDTLEGSDFEIRDDNPTEAAGLMLEWLIDNGYVKVEDINNAM